MLKTCANDPKIRKNKTVTQVSELSAQPTVQMQIKSAPKLGKVASRKRKHPSDSAPIDAAVNDSPQPNRRLADDMTTETLVPTSSQHIHQSQTSTNHTRTSNPAVVSPTQNTDTGTGEEVVVTKNDADMVLAVVRDCSTSKRGFKWTKEQDKHLIDAVSAEEEAQQKKKRRGRWERIAERMRQLVPDALLTGEMCRVRWSHYVGPMVSGLKKGESWNKAEVQKLKLLVAEHSNAVNGNTVINWPLICDAEHMNRIPQECRNKWYDLCDDAKEQGPFSEAENVLILDSVARWTHPSRKTGLWVSLGKDLNRPSKRIRDHWRCNLVPKDVDNSSAGK